MEKLAKKPLILCAALVFVALILTCAFSSVLAHYMVSDTATAFARVDPIIYTIRWVVDGEVVATGTTTNPADEVNKPADPTKTGTAQYSYDFKQWNKSVDGMNVTYTAEFTEKVNTYTVLFLNYDGALLKTQTVEYGSKPTPPADPSRANTLQYTYTFAGWDRAISSVTGDATYTAQFNYTFTPGVYYSNSLDYMRRLNSGTTKIGEVFPEGKATSWDGNVTVFQGDGTAYLQQWGWISYTADSFRLGHIINNGTPVYGEEHKYPAEVGLLEAVQARNPQAQCVTRFNTYLNISGLSAGEYNIKFVILLNGASEPVVVSEYRLVVRSHATVTYVYYCSNGAMYEAAATVQGTHTENVTYGSNAPNWQPPCPTGMSFAGYGTQINNITGDKTVYAQYTVNTVSNLNVLRKYRFKAAFDYIKLGNETLTGVESVYNGSSRTFLSYDGKSTDSSSKIVLKGWMGFILGQEELVWTIGTQTTADTTTVAGPWYSCVNGNYHAAEAAVISAIVGIIPNYSHTNDKNRFSNVEIDLSAYKGQTVNVIVAIRAADGNAAVCLEFKNLKVN